MSQHLAQQDGLYTVVERGASAPKPRVVGVMQRYIDARLDAEPLLQAIADRRTRMVTLTITASAYEAKADGPAEATAFDYLVEALRRRKATGSGGFTVVSCDNLADNGAVTRACVMRAAERRYPKLANWIRNNVAFPASMVDRITPPPEASRLTFDLRTNFGLHDRCPVATESFTQWVIEDSFCGGRPPLEGVGVEFVTDVRPFVQAKTRLLNGGHCAIAFLGHALGHRTSALAMHDPLVRQAITQMMEQEIAPTLGNGHRINLASYQRALLARLADEAVEDPIARLRQRGSIRMRNYLLPSLNAALAAGSPHRVLLLVLAAWIHHLRTYEGPKGALNDPLGGLLCTLARLGGDDPRAVLSLTSVFGDLRSHQPTVRALRLVLRHIDMRGMSSALSSLTAPESAAASDCVSRLPTQTRRYEDALYQKGA